MDVLKGLAKLPSESVDCIVTSPPYWALRDYGIEGQIGLESTYQEYISKLLQITQELKRVLKSTGSLWLNMGDTYGGSGKGATGYSDKSTLAGFTSENTKGRRMAKESWNVDVRPKTIGEIPKSLSQIPNRLAIRMADEQGWILRNIIIWNKPNAMPSSADDRFTNDYEHVFFFVKNKTYYFKQQFEKYTKPMNRWGGEKLKADGTSTWDKGTGQTTYRERNMRPNQEGRNKRAIWSINTEPYSEAHFACYPKELVEACLSAGCPDKGIVLDPFAGSGTTLQVAHEKRLEGIGIEINPKYVEIIKKRLHAKELLNREEFVVIV